MTLGELARDFADALAAVDATGAVHKAFRPGIGPFGEADAVRAALEWLKEHRPGGYGAAATRRTPDLHIPGRWAVEFKIVRPFGNNGKPAEHWSENILHPYPGNTSPLGDCIKPLNSGLPERNAVVIFGYEHSPPLVHLDPAIKVFELIADGVLRICLGDRIEERRVGLVHPVHQQLRVFAYEVVAGRPLTAQR